jgi:hypothetical protein
MFGQGYKMMLSGTRVRPTRAKLLTLTGDPAPQNDPSRFCMR